MNVCFNALTGLLSAGMKQRYYFGRSLNRLTFFLSSQLQVGIPDAFAQDILLSFLLLPHILVAG